jgi:hypothetical protein
MGKENKIEIYVAKVDFTDFDDFLMGFYKVYNAIKMLKNDINVINWGINTL